MSVRRCVLLLSVAYLSLLSSACRSTDHAPRDAEISRPEAAPEGASDAERMAAGGTQLGEPADQAGDKPGEKTTAGRRSATPSPGTLDCTATPPGRACCEALTPACNECRDAAQRDLTAWQAACLKPNFLAPDCSAPPVGDCCPESTAACQSCRAQALNKLLAWKEACAESPGPSCGKAPPQALCCQDAEPSCDACRARNQRLQDDWTRRCAKVNTAAPSDP